MWISYILGLALFIRGAVSYKCYTCFGWEAEANKGYEYADLLIDGVENLFTKGCLLHAEEFDEAYNSGSVPKCSQVAGQNVMCYDDCAEKGSDYVCTKGHMQFNKADQFGTKMHGNIVARGCELVNPGGCSNSWDLNPFFQKIVDDEERQGQDYYSKSVTGCACAGDFCNGVVNCTFSLYLVTIMCMVGLMSI